MPINCRLAARELRFIAARVPLDDGLELGARRLGLSEVVQRHAFLQARRRHLVAFGKEVDHFVEFINRHFQLLLGVVGFADPVLGVIGHLAGRVGLDVLAELADGHCR